MENEKRQELEQEIRNLQADLSSTASPIGDWKVAKAYEYQLAGLKAPYDVQELHEKRQVVRNRINEIQEELDNDPE